MVAVILSAILHLCLFCWFAWLHIGKLVIPAERARTFRSFEIHQVEIPPQALNSDQEQTPGKTTAVTPTEVMKALPEPGKLADPLLLANAPRPLLPDLPTGSISTIAPKMAAPSINFNPYAANDQAKITAEVSKFAVEPNLNSVLATDADLPNKDLANINVGQPTPGMDGKGTSGAGTAVPTLEQIQSQFRMSSPTIDPNLPIPVIVRLPSDILFDFDSYALRTGADGTLQLAVDYIKKFKHADVEVDGHTDTIGDEDYNLTLSTSRAQVVMNWLQQNINDPAYTWHAKGWGKSHPIVNPQGTKEQQEKNRRVEIVIRAVKPS